MKITNLVTPAVFSLIALVGCGGGGGGGGNDNPVTGGGGGGGITVPSYSGSTAAATVTSSNQQAVATTASLGAKQVISGQGGTAVPTLTDVDTEVLANNLADTSWQLFNSHYLGEQLPLAFVEQGQCTIGGSYSIDFPTISSIDSPASQIPNSGSGTFTFNDCDYGEGGVFDGVVGISWSGGASDEQGDFRNTTTTFDIEITLDGQTTLLQATLSCTDYGQQCSYFQYFAEGDIDYQLTDLVLSGDSSGYSVLARVYQENLGYIDVNGSDLTVCENGNIGTGTLSVRDSTNAVVLTVSFSSCSEMVVTFDGVAQTYQQ